MKIKYGMTIVITLIVVVFGIRIFEPKSATVTFMLKAPDSTAPADEIHIVGNFSDWKFESKHAMKLEGEFYRVEIPVSEKPLFYTFIKNQSWQHGPAQAYGKGMCQFSYNPEAGLNIVENGFPAWGGDKPTEPLTSSLVGNIEKLIDIDFPQLQTKRDVWVYLPPSYQAESNTAFPVLYMMDGQNVFDKKTSYSGEWQVDETLQQMFTEQQLSEFIVIAIDNGPRRMNEYSPWKFQYGDDVFEAEGEQTMKFITQTLKPLIDDKYRTQVGKKTTGIAGSSLGGLMAIYSALNYSNIFGYIGAFSPSLGIENEEGVNVLFQAIEQVNQIDDVVIYTDMGLGEYGDYAKFDKLTQLLNAKLTNGASLTTVKDDLGRHCEASWSERFPRFASQFSKN
ncbi:hypothetical protein KO525_14800 [Psychrosphaera sp. B3R10]|nr:MULTISPECIES: alpha/beta hydrolase-fold protein [unclassified Psychrosphaera]MBU2883250.1 hypothetical protein [Psychrosphaera sp. I2R16]MBU2990656.1 hypothetical protein [Psychrosphaera sp. B3R10]